MPAYNPIVVTATGEVYNGERPARISSIIVNANRDGWRVILRDAATNAIIYEADQGSGNTDRHETWEAPSDFSCTGVIASTLENITNVLVYLHL